MSDSERPQVIERIQSPRGELALRRAGEHFEIISNGVFLMDTRNGESERVLVRTAHGDVLIGGLGVGFSLIEALDNDAVTRVTVVELEPAIVEWHRTYLSRLTAAALADPRVELVVADLVEWLATTDRRFDAICLDIDNGPDWTVTPANAALYDDDGLRRLAGLLNPGGRLSVWSASRVEAFEVRLRRHFRLVEQYTIPVGRGEPDVVYIGHR